MYYSFKVGTGYVNLSNGERAFRSALGLGMILTVLAGNGPLGLMSLIPIIAIYPLMTASIGVDPFYRLLTAGNKARSMVVDASYLFSNPRGDGMMHESTAERIERTVVGAGLIAIPFAVQGNLGWLAVFPLLAIYPLMSAAIGLDFIDYLARQRRKEKHGARPIAPVTPMRPRKTQRSLEHARKAA